MGKSLKVRVVFAVAFLDLFAASMITTILASYLRNTVELSATLSGIIASVYGSVQFFSSPIVGGWSDRRGFHKTLAGCLSICVLGYSLLCSHWWPLLIASRTIAGVFKHTQNLCRSYIAEVSSEDEKICIFGRLNAVGNIGFMFGPALAGFLAERWSYELVFLLSSVIFAVNSAILWHHIPAFEGEGVKPQQETGSPLLEVFRSMAKVKWNSQWDLMLIRLLLSSAVLLYRSNFNWIVQEKFGLKPDGIGYLTSFQGGVAFFSSYYTGQFIAAFYPIDKVACFLHVVFLLFVSLSGLLLGVESLGLYMAFLALLCVSTSVMRVLSLDLTTERCEAHEKGLVIGASASVVSIARAVSPAIGGILHDLHHDATVYTGVFMTVISTFVIVKFTYPIHALWTVSQKKHTVDE